MVIFVVAGLSTLVAVLLAGSHRQPGDHPLMLLGFGGVLALLAGASRKAPALHLGMAAMSGFPIGALLDLARHGGHNLLPIEFALYAVYAGVGVVVAFAGQLLGRIIARR
ncbi:MAG TPA: hypothetical protein VFZ65_16310 [Planctomycetota bacterium]|nr:hypothetical protein [Planctomycetota bacterium]